MWAGPGQLSCTIRERGKGRMDVRIGRGGQRFPCNLFQPVRILSVTLVWVPQQTTPRSSGSCNFFSPESYFYAVAARSSLIEVARECDSKLVDSSLRRRRALLSHGGQTLHAAGKTQAEKKVEERKRSRVPLLGKAFKTDQTRLKRP